MGDQLFNLDNKVAIVTGGGMGIGRAICEVFAKLKAKVYILDIDDTSASTVETEILRKNGQAKYVHCNVADQAEVKRAFEYIFNSENSIDILINNAGIAGVGNVEQTTSDDMDRLYQVNVKSVYYCLHDAIPFMKRSGGGAIVNMASVVSVVGIPDRFAYTMSKGAVYAMTFSIAKDYVKENIRCNAIGPARIHTPFVDGFIAANYPGQEDKIFEQLSRTQPIGRMGKPKEVAYLAAYLCSDEAGFVTGSFYPIDGGFVTLNNP